ncbi:hypothetical protein DSO57_1028960 [Entomophthora muscae]|uniref:Uncharacterized protein n=1 Tax=Entomophthora muscae TaxID=34485 RepID=A0ACC2S370_9FUNG|nr:hypothetical protein DSO57_1028960 [Entomophthora muscae]
MNSQACDQCHFQRSRCNRRLPYCQSCKDKGMACTWNRILKYTPPQTYQNIDTFRIKRPTIRPKQDTSDPGYRTTTIIWQEIHKRWSTSSLQRHLLHHLKAAVGILPNQRRISKQIKVLSKIPLFFGYAPLYLNEHTQTYNLAFKQYFKNIHPFYPVLACEALPATSSNLLRLSILTSGLCLLPSSPTLRSLCSSIAKEIEHLIKPSQCKPNLDTLQSFLILYTSLQTALLIPGVSSLYPRISTLVFSLGLNRQHKFPALISVERSLCFNLFTTLLAVDKFSPKNSRFTPKKHVTFSCRQSLHMTILNHTNSDKSKPTLTPSKETKVLELSYLYHLCLAQSDSSLPASKLNKADLLAGAQTAMALIRLVLKMKHNAPPVLISAMALAGARFLTRHYHSLVHITKLSLAGLLSQVLALLKQQANLLFMDYIAQTHTLILQGLLSSYKIILPET